VNTDRNSLHVLLTASALAAGFVAAPAFAQEQADAAEAGEIIVTGEREVVLDVKSETGSRLNLSVREVPATLDVLTQERFLERGLRTTNEALNSAPGVSAMDTGGSPGTISMRGFGGNSVSHNYDGVHQPSTMTSRNFDTFAFERVEVLKGPASVLFGEGGIGGSVNYVPKKPILGVTEFSGLAQYGSLETFRVAGDVNAPINDQVAVRALASYAGSDGYIDRLKTYSISANAGVTIAPADNLNIYLAAEYFRKDDGPIYWGTPLVSAAVARDPSDLITTPNGLVFDLALRDLNVQYEDAKIRSDSIWLRSQVSWDINDVWTLRNDLSYNNGDRMWFDAESYSFNNTTNLVNRRAIYIRNLLDFWHERFTISSDGPLFGLRNRALIGVEHSENYHSQNRLTGPQTQVDPYNLVPGRFPEMIPSNFPGASNNQDSLADIRTTAVFGENALNITDSLLLVLGGRYERMKLEREITDNNLDAVTAFEREYNPFSYRAGLVYDIVDNTQLYAQYTRGAEATGTLVLISQGNAAFELTKGESAEAGVKSSFWGNRISATLAGFWMRQKDIITRDPDNPNVAVQGGAQSSRGLEFAISAALTRQLRLDANLSLLDSKYDELIEAGGAVRTGNKPANTPDQILNLFGVYQFDGIPLKLTAGMKYSGDTFGNTANTTLVKGYTIFDASIGYKFDFGDLTARVRNLTDETYLERGGTSTIYLGAPRTFDVTFRTKF
jgi:iron complex outermembrane receptor protein